MQELDLLGEIGVFVGLERGIHLLRHLSRSVDHLPYLPHDVLEKVEIAVFLGDDPFPVPLVNIRAVVMIQKVILAHRPHIGADTLADFAAKLLECHALPLGGSLHYLGLDTFVKAQSAGESHRSPGAIAVEIIIQAAISINNKRNLHHLYIELPGKVLLYVVLHRIDGFHSFHGRQKRLIIIRQDFLHFLVGADSRSGQICFFIRHFVSDGSFVNSPIIASTARQAQIPPFYGE